MNTVYQRWLERATDDSDLVRELEGIRDDSAFTGT